MRNAQVHLTLLLLLCNSLIAPAQKYLFEAQKLTKDDGLSDLHIRAVIKDNKGFIWAATKNGLNRYNGHTFDVYTEEGSGASAFQGVQHIQKDEKGSFWLFKSKNTSINNIPLKGIDGIDIFNPDTGKRISLEVYQPKGLPFKPTDVILSQIIDPKNRFWITTTQGALFLLQDGVFKKIIEKSNRIFQYITINEADQIFLGGNNNLLQINLNGEIIQEQQLPQQINGIWTAAQNQVWLATGTWQDKKSIKSSHNYIVKLWSLASDGQLMPFNLTKDNQKITIPPQSGTFIHRSQLGYWYIKIASQIQLFDKHGQFLFNYHTLIGKYLFTHFDNYFEDKSTLWIASPIGLIKTNVTKNLFKLIHKTGAYSDTRSITEDEFGNIYFHIKQLFQWNPKNQQVQQLNSKGYYILIHLDSIILSGRYSPIIFASQLNFRTKKKTDYLSYNSTLPYCALSTKTSSRFLIGTSAGLCFLDINKKKQVPFTAYNNFQQLEKSIVYFLYRNHQGIWIATDNGIFLMNETEGIIRHYDKASGHLPVDHIRHIHEDQKGFFWLATKNEGLIQWYPELSPTQISKSKQLTTQDGLSHNSIYAVYEDDFNHLWIPSDKGLMRLNKKTLQSRVYLTQDGLPHNEFNLSSHHQAKDGTLYFGGLGGLISFHPKDFVKEEQSQAPLRFLKYYLLEEGKEKLTDQTTLLNTSKEIIIKPTNKLFELWFTLLDYDTPKEHTYKYKIEGYSNHWNHINENYIQITNLPYGDYVLKIKGRNKHNGWSSEELTINIRVLKPFYLQFWFIIILLFIGIGTTVSIILRREIKLQKNRMRLEAEVQKRTLTILQQTEALKKLDQAKTRFFSNITHELRTPLTLILGPLEQILSEQLPPDIIRKRLDGVLKNTQHLLGLINQLLDLSKIENGQMKIEASRGDIIHYTKELTNRFQTYASQKKQCLNFIAYQNNWETTFDKNKWDKIIYNLLSNALKFTPTGNVIQISINRVEENKKEFIRLDIKDTGIGIEKNQLNKIFNRFYQTDSSTTRSSDGTGIGLALVKELVELQKGQIQVFSEVNKGTSFEIQLPVLKMAQPRFLTDDAAIPEVPISILEKEKNSFSQKELVTPEPKEKLELLIIEDNDEMREYIRHCIDHSKYHITEASDGQEGIIKAQEIIPDLIISDIMMPKKDGFEVTKIIRNTTSTSHIPLILLSAKSSLENRLEGVKRGADVYLTKPFNSTELAIRIQKLIEIRQNLQLRYQNEFSKSIPDVYEQEDIFIIELRQYILQHLDKSDLNGDRIGKHFGMSRVHLHRKLKALINQPITEFVRSIRLEKAKELIQEGQLNISEIAWQTGFSSVSYFSRSFKKSFGRAPSQM